MHTPPMVGGIGRNRANLGELANRGGNVLAAEDGTVYLAWQAALSAQTRAGFCSGPPTVATPGKRRSVSAKAVGNQAIRAWRWIARGRSTSSPVKASMSSGMGTRFLHHWT